MWIYHEIVSFKVMAELKSMTEIVLNDGNRILIIGFGTYKSVKEGDPLA